MLLWQFAYLQGEVLTAQAAIILLEKSVRTAVQKKSIVAPNLNGKNFDENNQQQRINVGQTFSVSRSSAQIGRVLLCRWRRAKTMALRLSVYLAETTPPIFVFSSRIRLLMLDRVFPARRVAHIPAHRVALVPARIPRRPDPAGCLLNNHVNSTEDRRYE